MTSKRTEDLLSQGKAFSKLTGKPFKYSRKTFRTKASAVANVSTEIGNSLLGQENANISANYLRWRSSLATLIELTVQFLKTLKLMPFIFSYLRKR